MARYDPKERFRYLKELVNEFHTSCSSEAKEQVLANLANFAYDPVNYDHFKRLNILSLFMDQLDSANDNLREFAIGGICNLSSDQDFRAEVLKPENLSKLISCLSTSQEETVLSTITTLISLGLSGCQTAWLCTYVELGNLQDRLFEWNTSEGARNSQDCNKREVGEAKGPDFCWSQPYEANRYHNSICDRLHGAVFGISEHKAQQPCQALP
ncbi:armadillo repeat-containing protein 7 isoform X1 [Dermacentor silvarum]|uniref:armadillo repeat-containing protein 7 isoform X1 n=1 Tax=Dermacentor silvarum TaxID=543639 RepID=UPI0021007F26|nr:armadillo repeat-containing protein 7 isoform X1 [Dermacentor silvarum]